MTRVEYSAIEVENEHLRLRVKSLEEQLKQIQKGGEHFIFDKEQDCISLHVKDRTATNTLADHKCVALGKFVSMLAGSLDRMKNGESLYIDAYTEIK